MPTLAAVNQIAPFPNIIKHIDYTMAFDLKRPREIRWRMVDGDALIRSNDGWWKFGHGYRVLCGCYLLVLIFFFELWVNNQKIIKCLIMHRLCTVHG